MKFLKTITLIILSCLILLVGAVLLLRMYIVKNMEDKRTEAITNWSHVYNGLNKRTNKIHQFVNLSSTKDPMLDTLNSICKESINRMPLFKKNLDTPFIMDQYHINRLYLNAVNKDPKSYILFNKSLKELDSVLNAKIYVYNSSVKDYNMYLSTFPNFLFTRKNGYFKMKYLEITFGEKNEDPQKKRAKALKSLAEFDGN